MEKVKKKNKRFDNSVLWGIVAILLIVEIMSCTMLVSQLSSYSKPKVRNYISLTDASDRTTVEITRKTVAAMNSAALDVGSAFTTTAGNNAALIAGTAQRSLAPETDKPLEGFIIEDKDKIWTANTEVEIFKISYDNNGDAVFTVQSDGTGEVKKLIAPGTNFDYEFTLKNTGDKPLDYTLIFESWFEGTDEIIPVEAKVFYNEDGQHYLLGGADEWKPVLDLNGVTRDAGLNAGNICDYTLQWQWPFERFDGEGLDANDAFDTMLGNLAASGEELTLTIVIKTVAWIDEQPCTTGENPPQTGDDRPIIIWVVIAITALAAIIFLPLFMKRREREEAQEA